MLISRKILRGSLSNIVRLVLSILIGAVLPPILVHHLSQTEYSAWVLILQLSAYVNLLDLGLQTVVAKLIAEHSTSGNKEMTQRLAGSAFSLLSIAACLGALLVGVMVWRVPYFFREMPPAFFTQVRLSLLLIGLSSAFALPFSTFLAIFSGLQEYGLPMVVGITSRLLSAIALAGPALFHGDLLTLAFALTAVNVSTSIAQFFVWRHRARERVPFTFFDWDRRTVSLLARSGGVIAIWILGGLFVSGLDLIIVGRFDFANTGFYAIASTAANLMPMIVGSLFSPLLPAVSSAQTTSTPAGIGALTIRVSRFCTLLLCLMGAPLGFAALPLLTLWVGHTYALRSVTFLQLLVLGNIIRQLGYPYSLVVIATGKQRLATLASVTEAIVNLSLSVWLASRMGALGVALGTLAGAFVSIGLHLTVSMRKTRPVIDLSAVCFLRQSLLRPLLCFFPLLFLFPYGQGTRTESILLTLRTVVAVAIAALVYHYGLTAEDRAAMMSQLRQVGRSQRVKRPFLTRRS